MSVPKTSKTKTDVSLRTVLFLSVLTFLLGIGLAAAVGTANLAGTGQWFRDFAKSPAVAGLAAIVAAMIAYRGLQSQVRASNDARAFNEAAHQANSWWSMFEWASERAIPADAAGKPLPQAVIISTLESLAATATTDTQKAACAGIISALSGGEKDEEEEGAASRVGHAAETDGAGPGTQSLDEEALRALESYVTTNRGTRAESSAAESLVYANKVLKSLMIMDRNNVRLLRQEGNARWDAEVRSMGRRVPIEIKRFSSAAHLRRYLTGYALRRDFGLDFQPIVLITPQRISLSAEEEQSLGVILAAWESPTDNEAVRRAILRAAEFSAKNSDKRG